MKEETMTSHPELTVQVAGGWLAGASLLLVGALAFHPPPSADPDEFMRIIADAGTRWVVVHWIAALALSAFVVASLIVLSASSRLTSSWMTVSAWGLLPVSALWVVTTAVAEATVISHAAVIGAHEMFHAWHLFAEGKGMGFLGIALSTALIAGNEARARQPAVPASACWVAAAAALAALCGWTLGTIFGVTTGGIIWLFSTLLMSLWILWFGLALARSGIMFVTDGEHQGHAVPPS
jgi:hypothetical protein